MRNNTNLFSKKLVWLLTVGLFSAITIFESYTWGKYILIIACFLILSIDIIVQKGKYYCYIDKYTKYIICLMLFSLFSALWGISASDSLIKAFTFFQILICMMILYNHYKCYADVKQLLSCVKWSSYIISIYSIIYYGYEFLAQMMLKGIRIDNGYTNINTIGMLAAIGILIQIDELFQKHKITFSTFFCIPSFFILISTQSRKAILILTVGFILIIIMYNLKQGVKLSKILKIIFMLSIAVCLIGYLSTFDIFKGINKRMGYLIAIFTGQGEIGASILTRQNLIRLGMNIFKENCILGIGMGCPSLIVLNELQLDAYLHNGFVEMLAAGGIVGFTLYYSSYIYLLWNFYKFRNTDDQNHIICIILTVILLFRDYAMVSVYSKVTYFYFMIFFLQLDALKKHNRTVGKVKRRGC